MTDPKVQVAMLAEYTQETGLYRDLAATVAQLIEHMLQRVEVQLHSITHRSKKPESLARKLAKPEKDYRCLADITDLAAIRITTYFAEDVDSVAEIVEREFNVDVINSIDKRKLLDPDRFGYQSLHYVASMTAERCKFVEYSRFDVLKFEIQVRSILQHAWAEIEHDLGYKSAVGVPKEIRRRFSRIAGLLELADDEFSAIRKELDEYAATMPREIQEQPQNVSLDKISLMALVMSEESYVRAISQSIAMLASADLEPIPDTLLESSLSYLNFLEITTVAELEEIAKTHRTVVEEFARHWLEGSRYQSLHEGIGILYLTYVLLAEHGDDSRVRKFVNYASLSGGSEETTDRIKRVYQLAMETLSEGTGGG